ncbi:MAG: hypothetical protein HY579_13080, partial [Nitrospinae bacterium]|nr:hypothetical protein [Nitrospinota bacterium]
MDSPNPIPQKSSFLKIILATVLAVFLINLSPAPKLASFANLGIGPQLVLAADDEEEDEDADEEEDEDEGGAKDEEKKKDEKAKEEEDDSWKYDIGPAKEHKITTFTFPGLGNRKATWFAAQLHILFASFILGCPMFVIIMEVMGARRTQGVRKAIILSNVFLGVLLGVTIGIIGEIILGIHHGV